MTNIQFSTGTYKEYQLNGKETIRINVSDPNIIDRVKGIEAKIDAIQSKYGDVSEANYGAYDKEIRAVIDEALDCPGACEKAFGSTNCMSISGGNMIVINFVNALFEQLQKDIIATSNAEKIKLDDNHELNNERTQKYITQSKPAVQPPRRAVQTINVAALSQEERERLLNELIGAEQG